MALECFNKWHIWMVYYDVYIEALAAYFPINIFKNYSDTHFLSYSDLYRKFHGSESVKDPSDVSEIVQYGGARSQVVILISTWVTVLASTA